MLDSLVRVSRRVLKVPKAIASQIGSRRSVRELRRQQSPEVRTGTRSEYRQHLTCLRRVERSKSGLEPFVYRRASRPGHAGPDVKTEILHPGSTARRRPTPNGSRRPTRRKVHAFVARSKNRRCEKRERFPSLDRLTPTTKRE